MVKKIDAKILKKFIDTLTFGGDSTAGEKKKLKLESVKKSVDTINEIVLNFTENGVIINCNTSANTVASIGLLKKEAFSDYEGEVPSKIGIGDSATLVKILNSFTGIVNLDVNVNLLTIYNENKFASIVLSKPEHLNENTLPDNVVEQFNNMFKDKIELNSECFFNTVENINIVKSDAVYITVKDKKLEIETGEKNFDKIKEIVDCDYKDVKATYPNSIARVIRFLDEKVEMSIEEDNGPLQFSQKNDYYDIKLIVAPLDGGSETVENSFNDNLSLDNENAQKSEETLETLGVE